MNRKSATLLLGSLAFSLALGGCATKGYVNDRMAELEALNGRVDGLEGDTAELRNSTEEALRRAESAAGSAAEARDLALGRAGLEEVSNHTVYFAFDSDDLSDDACAVLEAAAHEIQGHPEVLIDVYGFTDAAGSPQYNLALGERRAQSVVRYLLQRTPGQLSRYAAVSFGEGDISGLESGGEESRRVVVSLIRRTATGGSSTASLARN